MGFQEEYIDEIGLENTALGQEIVNWAKKNIEQNFTFRENQLEIIHSIISNILDNVYGKPTHIVEAPTGSGKSLILIISAGVLSDIYGKTSYILCSDLSLWKQYDKLIESSPELNNKIARIKGQSGANYECMRNHQSLTSAECKLAKIRWEKLFNPIYAKNRGFECAKFCKYIKDRYKALTFPITLMTYQQYIKTVGRGKEGFNPHQFKPRDIIFCDECHNIPDIVQSTFGLTIKESIIDNLLTVYRWCLDENSSLFKDDLTKKLENEAKSISISEIELKNNFYNLFNKLKDEDDKEVLYDTLTKLNSLLDKFNGILDIILDIFSNIITNKDYISKEQLEVYNKCERIKRLQDAVNVYLSIFEADNRKNIKYLVKSVGEEKYIEDIFGKKVLSKYPANVNFRYALEDFLINQYFLASSKNQVMVSATIGGHKTFVENCGIENHNYEVLPSTFDFSQSPIYYLSRWKMSNAYKEKNFPKIKSAIYELCNRFNDKKGIIQTHTYENAKEIYDSAPEEIQSRMLLYSGSQAKQELIEYHKDTEVPTILIGPTLSEGVDLPGDECRFIIMMKMPYPYLGDNLVKAKMELFPEWYDNETAKNVIQSIGRGNRYHDDWCITYILDGCFSTLYNKTKDQFPMNIRERLKFFA